MYIKPAMIIAITIVNRMLKVTDLVGFALFWLVNLKAGLSHECNITSSPKSINTTRSCYISLSCETSTPGCNLDILYKEDNSTQIQEIREQYCNEQGTVKNCYVPFERSCAVWCVAPGNDRSDPVQIYVLEYLDKVEIVRVIDASHYFQWEQPHIREGIKLEYKITFMYDNGTVIDNATVNQSEYSLPQTFDKCELVILNVVAKASCGDVSSNSSSWSGSVLSPSLVPEDMFNQSLEQVEGGVSLSLSYLMNINCPSARALSADLSCYYKIRDSRQIYELMVVVLKKKHVSLIDAQHNNESVVLMPNEKAQCSLTLVNDNGRTKQWTKNISTFSVQDFNISKVNKTHVCVEFWSFKGTAFQYKYILTLNNTNGKERPHKYELNKLGEAKTEEKVHKCFTPSVPNGLYWYCVYVDGDDHYCVFESFENVTDGSVDPNHSDNNSNQKEQTILGISLSLGALMIIVVLTVLVTFIVLSKRFIKSNVARNRNKRIEIQSIQQVDMVRTSDHHNLPPATCAPELEQSSHRENDPHSSDFLIPLQVHDTYGTVPIVESDASGGDRFYVSGATQRLNI